MEAPDRRPRQRAASGRHGPCEGEHRRGEDAALPARKVRLGKLQADPVAVARAIDASGVVELPVTSTHAARVATLPRHHEDPFERLLVAQAFTEPLVLLTADAALEA